MNLTDAIGKDIFIFEDKQYADGDFLKMTSEELATFKARLNLKATNIADIIRERKKLESREWHSRRKYALSLHNKMIPYVNYLLKRRYKSERNLGDCFMDQARLVLPAGDYEKILTNAEKELGRGNN